MIVVPFGRTVTTVLSASASAGRDEVLPPVPVPVDPVVIVTLTTPSVLTLMSAT